MDLKKEIKEIIKWAQELEKNKKKAILAVANMISVLNKSSKELSEVDLEDIAGSGCSITYLA